MDSGRRPRPNRQGRGGGDAGRGRGRGRGGRGGRGRWKDNDRTPNNNTDSNSSGQSAPTPSHPRAISHRDFQSSRPPRPPRSDFQRPHRQSREQRNYSTVPPRSALIPGTTRVSIVLKEDQPTGKEVQGVVGEILTRGDHPRGVKVRLTDGRVGRVQRMIVDGGGSTEGEALRGEVDGDGPRAEGWSSEGERETHGTAFTHRDMYQSEETRSRGRGRGRGPRRGGALGSTQYTRAFHHTPDVRDDPYTYDESPQENHNLGAYFDAALQRMEALDLESETRRAGAAEMESATAMCPVCGEFEGDERAVGWHVERVHFGGE